MKIWHVFFLVLWANLASGQTATITAAPKNIVLASITSDYTDKKYELSLDVDQKNDIQLIKTYSAHNNKFKEYALDVLMNRITLVKAAGIQLITLRCIEFKPESGCKLEIYYPSNLAVANFSEYYAKLVRTKDSWELQTEEGFKINRLHLIAKKAIGLLVGIKRIEVY